MICLEGRDSQIPTFSKGVAIYLANFAKNGIERSPNVPY